MKKSGPHRKLLREFCELSGKILRLANRGQSLSQFLGEVSVMLLDFSCSDLVDIRIAEEQLYILYEMKSREKERPRIKTFEDLSQLWRDGYFGEIRKSVVENAVLGSVPYSSPEGSVLVGDEETPGSCRPGEGEKINVHSLADMEGHHGSFLFIPISVGGRNIGILEFGSQARDHFLKQEIQFYEGMAQTLGSALLDRRAQAALRERVKELTCLYGIAQATQQRVMTLVDVLQSILRLLPPAFQYPDHAGARVVVDEHIYCTDNYRVPHLLPERSDHSIKGDIYVHGEKRGFVEVGYPADPGVNEGILFLKEEIHLVNEVARQISLIVERGKIEDEKENLQDQLRHADRLATIGQLSAGVAHELNEPLGNILGFAQLAQKDRDLSRHIARDLEKIIDATLYARDVVKKLLIFARQLPVQRTKVSLNAVVTEGLTFFESRCRKEGIDLKRSLAVDMPWMVMDPSQLHQVLVNLVVNAIQAMPEGGVLRVGTECVGREVLLIVEDTGIGMSKSTRENIFMPFFTTKQVGQGTGLGLAVVHGIVTKHGGTIEVESEESVGSSFRVRFPLDSPEEP